MSREDWKCPDDRFPVMGLGYARPGEAHHTVPMLLVLEHEPQAFKNHGQSVARLKARGGLSWCELAAVLGDREYRRMDRDGAHEAAMRRVLAWQDRQRRNADARAPTMTTPTPGRTKGEQG
jgi:lambda repressor-like predicted transcriptional regulator